MGIIAYVHRCVRFGDGSNSGVSATHDTVCVVNAEGPFQPTDQHPPVVIVDRGNGTMTAYPAVLDDTGVWVPENRPNAVGPMDGGTFIAASDSRFRPLTGFYGAVAFHDRYETPTELLAPAV